jgi:hypothetical protein
MAPRVDRRQAAPDEGQRPGDILGGVKLTCSRALAALLIATLLFAQGALATYACPMALAAPAAEAPCADMEMDSAPLCHRHCADEKQKPHDGAFVPATDFFPAFVVRLPLEPDPSGSSRTEAPAEQAAPPPLILRNRRLRI